MMKHPLIGIEIGGTKLQLTLADPSMALQQSVCLRVNKAEGAQGIRRQIETGLQQLTGGEAVTAAGIGFGGPVNHITGKISVSHQINGWEDFDLKQWLQELIAAPVFIDNDANVAALGEALHGAGKQYKLVFYMTLGSGIGGGIVQQGSIYHGAIPGEVEIGHVRLNREGQTLESLCCGWAVDQKIRNLVQQQPAGLLAQLVGNTVDGEARFLKAALEQQDTAANAILQEVTDNIAFALSHVVHLFHPDVIIIGGGLSFLGEHLTGRIVAALPRYLMTSFLPPPPVRISALGEQAVPIGALELAKSVLRLNTNV
jgi:glucokinase